MDEAAHAMGQDPLAFRLKMLDGAGRNAGAAPSSVGGAKRQAAVLSRVAKAAGWGGKLPAGVGLGLALAGLHLALAQGAGVIGRILWALCADRFGARPVLLGSCTTHADGTGTAQTVK
jgi:hypothetical protein